MPCWTVQESTIELHNPNSKLLRRALKAAGFTNHRHVYARRGIELVAVGFSMDRFADRASVTLRDGRVIVAGAETTDLVALTSEVKRAYSAQVVRTASQRFGWTVKQVGTNRYQAQRRG